MDELARQNEENEIVNLLAQELNLHRKEQPENSNDWLVEWVLKKVRQAKDEKTNLKLQYEAMKNHIDAYERALFYRWGSEFRQQVDERLRLQAGKTKSINTLSGRAGYRKAKPTVEIEDNQAAIEWAVDNLSRGDLIAAISSLNKTPLLSAIALVQELNEDTGEVIERPKHIPAGCRYIPEQEKFYPHAQRKELPSAKRLHELERSK